MTGRREGPPRLLETALSVILASKSRNEVIGDLREEYEQRCRREGHRKADHWYLSETLRSVGPSLLARLPQGTLRLPGRQVAIAETTSAIRSLRRHPAQTATIALTLGVGVGAAVAVFSIAGQLWLRPLPGIGSTQSVAFLELRENGAKTGLSGPAVAALRSAGGGVTGLASHRRIALTASAGQARPVSLVGVSVYGDYFEMLGVRPHLGRLLSAADAEPSSDPLIGVISEGLWTSLFQRDPNVVGQRVRINGHAVTVIGVAGGGFVGPERGTRVDLWVPHPAMVPLAGVPPERAWSADGLLHQEILVERSPDISTSRFEARLKALLEEITGQTTPTRSLEPQVFPGLHTVPRLRESTYQTLGTLGGMALLVLLIACSNVANLLLLKGIDSRSELAVHRAVGASSASIVRQHMLHSLLLAVAGCAVGLVVASGIGLAFRGEALWGLPTFQRFSVDGWTAVFGLITVAVTTLCFGGLPATMAAGEVSSGGLRATARPRSFLQVGLSALQVGLSVVLLVGSVLLGRTVLNLYAVESGVEIDDVWAATVDLRSLAVPSSDHAALYASLLAGMSNAQGVSAVALDTYGPFGPQILGRIATLDQPLDPEDRVQINWVSPEWFDLLGVEPASGRRLTATDLEPAPVTPVVLTETLARRLFPQGPAIGQRVRVGPRGRGDGVVVGVTGPLRLTDLRSLPDEVAILPYTSNIVGTVTLLVRGELDASQLDGLLASTLETVVPDAPMPVPEPITDRVNAQLGEQRVLARLLGILSALAVFLACVGLYSVVASGVAERRHEFGLRIALGAGRPLIAALVLRLAGGIVVVGLTLGLLASYLASKTLERVLFGVGPADPASYVMALSILGLVALGACVVPATSAARVDPANTLRRP